MLELNSVLMCVDVGVGMDCTGIDIVLSILLLLVMFVIVVDVYTFLYMIKHGSENPP